MELINPKITIQNTNEDFWVVRMEHTVSAMESIDITLKVKRITAPLDQVQRHLVMQAISLLTTMRDRLGN